MSKYKCETCGAEGVKLWREYGMFFRKEDPKCVDCACAAQSKDGTHYCAALTTPDGKTPSPLDHCKGRPSYEIGWMVPLITTEDEETIWGYTSCRPEDIARWEALPLRKS